MRGVARSGLFKSQGADKSSGHPTASLPAGVDASSVPVVVGFNAILHNPKNLMAGSVNPPANIPAALRANLKNIAVNSPRPPTAMVVLSVYYKPNINLVVNLLCSRSVNFHSSTTLEKNLTASANSGVIFSLNNLMPGTTYYLKAQAQSLEIPSVNSAFTSTIIINTPVAPTTGFFAGVYYIEGEPTPLNASGTGEWNGVYYVNGAATNLVNNSTSGWSGTYANQQYYNGALAHGLINGQWWYYGNVSTEQFFYGGNGHFTDGLFYQNYQPFTGQYNGQWYFKGELKPMYNGQTFFVSGYHTYYNGELFDGLLGGVFYVGGLPTTLGANGVGIWNNAHYSGGVYVGSVGNPYDSGQTSSQGSRFSEGVTYG
jgi:hypothetical protein